MTMTMTMTALNSWMGNDKANKTHHDECFARYDGREPRLAACHFQVANDLSAVEIVHAANEPDSSNGIWTLAELLATGETWEAIDRIAALMCEKILKAND